MWVLVYRILQGTSFTAPLVRMVIFVVSCWSVCPDQGISTNIGILSISMGLISGFGDMLTICLVPTVAGQITPFESPRHCILKTIVLDDKVVFLDIVGQGLKL